ncbi:MAG: M3 family oligoendopeptidase [Candidatus Omnitrophica bacterium]|nr:M3 family oligoendopeptidase [Candidatus Omnitrophota bacterium]
MGLRNLFVYQPRTFVPQDAHLTDKDTIVGLLRRLLDRNISSSNDLEKWLLHASELGAAVGQAASILYIEMTCQTDDPKRAKAYQDFVENVEPVIKPLSDEMNRKYLKLRETLELPKERYLVYDRAVKTAVEMFCAENIPLQTELALLSQEYQAVSGVMTVEFDGKERTLPEMSKFLLENDRALRERAWRAVAARRLKDAGKFEEIFDKMRALRQKIAVNAKFANYRDYQFKAYLRFDYTPEDCKAYHRAIKEVIVPLRREMDARRCREMKLAELKPWDAAVDPLGRTALKPFTKAEELTGGVGRMMARLDPELAGLYEDMKGHGLLDLENRKGKAPGGYQNTLTEARKPFIFMNAIGIDDDVRTLLHESGHAFHAYLCAHDPLDDYRHAPMEFCEVASMSMELMADKFMGEFYSEEAARRSSIEHLEGVVATLAWVATIDSFQHWIYENPNHTAEDRRTAWLKAHADFGGNVMNWDGLDAERASLWHRQLHIFEVPFYYIEYGIAQLGALGIWRQFRHNPAQALVNYKKALTLGGSRPLPELFQAAGLTFGFSKDMIAPLMDEVTAEWKRLS